LRRLPPEDRGIRDGRNAGLSLRRDRREEDLHHGGTSALRIPDGACPMSGAGDLLTARLGGLVPSYGIVLGSGLGGLTETVRDPLRIPYADLPSFPAGSVS